MPHTALAKMKINCKKGLGKFLDFQIVCMQDKATFSFRPAFSLSVFYENEFFRHSKIFNVYSIFNIQL